jgi:hypothetical protein
MAAIFQESFGMSAWGMLSGDIVFYGRSESDVLLNV